ncbi:MAG: hypothetical protein WAV56_00070 [Microgenomates group bacterium]
MGKLIWHQVVLFSVLTLLTLMRYLTGTVGFDISLLWWWLGGMIGFLFVFADRLVYALMSHPEETLSLKLKELFGKGKIVTGLAFALTEREKQDKLMMRSVLFLVVWAILTVLTLTSIANSFSRGFMLGLSTHLVFDLGWDYFTGKGNVDVWFWQVRNVTVSEKNIFVWGTFVFYSLTVWFL